MPFFEILKAGKLVKRVQVARDKAVAGCTVRVGTAGTTTLKLGESARVGEYDVRLMEDSVIAGQSATGESVAGGSVAGGSVAGQTAVRNPAGAVPRLEGYKIQHQLGEGGMGTVWQGIQLSTKRPVAIKFLSARAFESERAQRRFVREVELSAKLEHPNIARIYDSGLRHGAYYYAMELVQGVTLDQYVENNQLGQSQILSLLRTVCQAMHHAHQRDVVHRDLKPGNIMIDSEGKPRVVDFGLAKSLQVDETEKQMTVSIEGNAAGTPAYMSPEQAIGRIEEIDCRSDVYSLGVILYRLIVGQPPIDLSGSRFEVMQRIVRNEIRPPRQFNKSVNADLDGLLRKCLALAPADRYADAGSLADDIENYLLGRPLRARKATAMYLLGKRLARHRIAVSAAVAGCALAVSIAIGLLPNGWLRQRLSLTQIVTVDHAAIVKEVVVPAAQSPTKPVEHGKLEDAVPFQSQADVLWEQVKSVDRNQGLGEQLDAAAAKRLSAGTLFDKGVYDSAADNYRQFIKLCGAIHSADIARRQAVGARQTWRNSVDAAKKAGVDTSAIDVSTDTQASERFEAGDFAAARSSWVISAHTVETQTAKHSAAVAAAKIVSRPTTRPEKMTLAAPFVVGKFGNALQFDGMTNYADMGDPADHRFDLGAAATLETWIKFAALPADGKFVTFISKDEGEGRRNKWIFGYASDYAGLKNRLFLSLGFGDAPHPDNLLWSEPWIADPGYWHHVAVTKSGNNYIFYRDGVICGHMRAEHDAPRVNHSLLLGAAESRYRLCGVLDEVRFWNIARTGKQIQSDMNHEIAGNEPGLVAHWRCNEFSGTTVHDLSGSDSVGVFYGNHGLPGGPDATQQIDLNRGMVLHFSFNSPAGDGVVKDESGNSNNGQVLGAKWVADGPGPGAYLFNAANRTDAILVADSPSLNPECITEAAWVKTHTVDKWWRRIIDKSYRTSYDLTEGGGGSGSIPMGGKAIMNIGVGDNHRSFSDQSIADGKWHHIVSTYDGVQAKCYIDGTEQKGELAWPGRVSGNSEPLRIGNGPPTSKLRDGTPNVLAFDGEIGDVRIYNRALSLEEVVALRDSVHPPAPAAQAAGRGR